MLLDGTDDLELALRLFRDDRLMAKREARRKQYFVAPSARRKMKAIAARKRAARARLKRSG
jgi:ribosomal protein S21